MNCHARTATLPLHRSKGRPGSRRHDLARLLIGAWAATTSPCTDFRSAFSDWAHEQTAHANHTIELSLAHNVGSDVERAYRRGPMLAKRVRLMADWARYCPRRRRRRPAPMSCRSAGASDTPSRPRRRPATDQAKAGTEGRLRRRDHAPHCAVAYRLHHDLEAIPSPGDLKKELKDIGRDLKSIRAAFQKYSAISKAMIFEKDEAKQKAFLGDLDRLIVSAQFYHDGLLSGLAAGPGTTSRR